PVGQVFGRLFPSHELVSGSRADVPGNKVGELFSRDAHLGIGVFGLAEHVFPQCVQVVGPGAYLVRIGLNGIRKIQSHACNTCHRYRSSKGQKLMGISRSSSASRNSSALSLSVAVISNTEPWTSWARAMPLRAVFWIFSSVFSR